MNNPSAKKVPATCVFFLESDEDWDSAKNKNSDVRHIVWQRAKRRGWSIERFKGDHNSQKNRPAELAEFLRQIALNHVDKRD